MLSSTICVENNLDQPLSLATGVSPALSPSYWSVYTAAAGPVEQVNAYWVSRYSGITSGETWVFSTTLTLAGTPVALQVRLVGSWHGSDISIRVTAGTQDSGWSDGATVAVSFSGGDGRTYRVSGAFVSPAPGEHDDVQFSVAAPVLPQIKHVVVLMMENRSLDNLLGWIYEKTPPAHVLPEGSPAQFNGLAQGSHANQAPGVNDGQPVPVTRGTTSWTVNGHTLTEFSVPNPDPGEAFADVAEQISGGMGGFLSNYLPQTRHAGGPDDSARQIMEAYAPEQVPVITALATGYAVSDAWHASVPSQTWPNRYFLLSGTCFGKTDNDLKTDTDGSTLFDVLTKRNIPWAVYSDNTVSLVKVMFWRYWFNSQNFGGLDAFTTACQAGTLPPFSFLEPSFGLDFDDYKINVGIDRSYHPPYDLRHGEALLAQIHETIRNSPNADEILFLVLFDEHGGTYDHLEPPTGARPPLPDPVGTDTQGTEFTFHQFGVRVPAIVVSPYVRPGTVFRSPTDVPFDHTSMLATVRDWLGLQVAFKTMLPSPRIAAAPTLASVLQSTPVAASRPTPTPLPIDPNAPAPAGTTALNPIQRALAVAAAVHTSGLAPTADHFASIGQALQTIGDLQAVTAPPASPSAPPATPE